MPVYLYRNLTTNETFELEQRITAPALTHHPETGDPVKRLIQPVGIAFKGSGFYVTDSRPSNGAGKAASKADSGKAEGGPVKTDAPSKSGESKTESKSSSAG
jgi:predicted nucleic acid-binding Zn ribbon protein